MDQLGLKWYAINLFFYQIGMSIEAWSFYQDVIWDVVVSIELSKSRVVMNKQLSLAQLHVLKIKTNGVSELNYKIMTKTSYKTS